MGNVLQITLASARVNAGYTQELASKELGVTKRTLSNWERGVTMPPVHKIDSICELYGVSYDNLIFLPRSSLKAN